MKRRISADVAASKFWLDDGIPSINIEFEHPLINSIWMETNQVDTQRIILKAFGPSGFPPQQLLAAFCIKNELNLFGFAGRLQLKYP